MKICTVEECSRRSFAKGYCQMHYRRVRIYGDPNTFQRFRPAGDEWERFFARVDKGGSCWIWTGRLYRNGYGNAWNARKKVGQLAHRYAYEALVGPIPEGMQLDHICHERACVNPTHLRPVTNKQNNENQQGNRINNRYGLRGVGFNKRTNKYRARVHHLGREYYAGEYATPEEAAEAARQLRLSLFTHNDLDRRAAA